MRAFGRILTAAPIATLAILGFAGGMAADCQGEPPPFGQTVASAKQVVIGDVVAVRARDDLAGGPSSRFTLQVTHIVRGDSFARVEINDVATQPCANQIVAAMGDRIALALGATAYDPPILVNAVAWIVGQPPEGFEVTTVEDVYRLAGVPRPEPGGPAAALKADPPPTWLGPVIWGVMVALVVVAVGLVGRRLVTS